MFDNGLAEIDPLLSLSEGNVEGCLLNAGGLCRYADTPAFQIGQGDTMALSLFFQAQRGRDANVQNLSITAGRSVWLVMRCAPPPLRAALDLDQCTLLTKSFDLT
jgi:hypothetical protein